jgi:hypothetical protein
LIVVEFGVKREFKDVDLHIKHYSF